MTRSLFISWIKNFRAYAKILPDRVFIPEVKSPIMKCMMVIVLAIACLNGFSQNSSTWEDNVPGYEPTWEWPGNWSTKMVSDEFTEVIIPLDCTSGLNYPAFSQVEIEITSLFINPLAYSELKNGVIKIIDAGKSLFLKVQLLPNLRRKLLPGTEISAEELTNIHQD